METRLVKRQRLQRNAQEALERNAQLALERNIAYWRARGVPPGVVHRVLRIARLLRGVLPVNDVLDKIVLEYLAHIRRPFRQFWGYLRPMVTINSSFMGFRLKPHVSHWADTQVPWNDLWGTPIRHFSERNLYVRGGPISNHTPQTYISRATFYMYFSRLQPGYRGLYTTWEAQWPSDQQRAEPRNAFFPPNRTIVRSIADWMSLGVLKWYNWSEEGDDYMDEWS